MKYKRILFITSALESSLGILLLLIPSVIVNLLFGIETTEIIKLLCRLTGIVYFCFGIACMPGMNINNGNDNGFAVKAMFIYNLSVAVYFFYISSVNIYKGELLLPAAVLHSLITAYFIFLFFRKNADN
ncbi:MAG: hypothetical protein JNJ56_11535 [Ignavibacteria bacterium]|nr:hypothetical protein [Ignavibacteria bacterium]